MKNNHKKGLAPTDIVILFFVLLLWIAMFLIGTLISSQPFRTKFIDFEGGFQGIIKNGFIVVITYTLTNVAFLSILAGILGAIGAKAVLCPGELFRDVISPKCSAILRAFLVYLALLAGVLLFGNITEINPTQIGYVRLAGIVSLIAFAVNYNPTIFARLLESTGHTMLSESKAAKAKKFRFRYRWRINPL